MTHFDHPSPWLVARILDFCLLLLTTRSNMRDIVTFNHCFSAFRVIVPFVRTQILFLFLRRLGPFDHDGIQRLRQQFHVVPVGASHHERDRYPFPLCQETPLRPSLPTVGRVRSGGAPPSGAFVMAPSILSHFHSKPCKSS